MRRTAVVLGCVALGVWLLFYANWPARQVAQVTLHPPGSAPVRLTLWKAEPLVEIPFTTNSGWVRFGERRWKLHGRAFGSGVGRVAVSPDATQALVHRSFEGGEFPCVLIDLRTGEMRSAHRLSRDVGQGCTMLRSHTALEPMIDEELMRELRSGDPARFRAACHELKCRPFTQEHWPKYAAVALDPKVPDDRRRYLPYLLYHDDDEVGYAEQKTGIFAKTADPDPQVRLFAAWALCEFGQVTPAREFDLLDVWRRGPTAADAEVESVRSWWVSNAEPEYWKAALPATTTAPVVPSVTPTR